jgi:hypothetical protein
MKFKKKNKIIKQYDFLEKLKEQHIWEQNHPILHKLHYIFWKFPVWILPNYIISIPFRIREFYRRHTKGITYSDLWDLDNHIVRHIKKSLIAYKKINTGYPCEMSEEEFDSRIDTIIEGCDEYLNRHKLSPEEEKVIDNLMSGKITSTEYLDAYNKLDSVNQKIEKSLKKIRTLFDDDFFPYLWD